MKAKGRVRREVRVTEWEHLAAVYASWYAWEKRWPRGVAKAPIRTIWRFVALAAAIFAVTAGPHYYFAPEKFEQRHVWIAYLAFAGFGALSIARSIVPDPRLRLIAARRTGKAWLARRDLAVRVTKRREHWAKILERSPANIYRRPSMSWPAIVPFVALVAISILRDADPHSMSLVPTIFLPMFLFFVLWIIVSERRLRARAVRSLTEPVCLDCGYKLTGLDDMVARWEDVEVDLGPTECPECGMPWPRIPPQPLSDP